MREKIFRFCGQELPYSVTVDIESFKDEGKLVRIHALILVEKDNHKRMIIGDKGQKLKEMATECPYWIWKKCWVKKSFYNAGVK